MHMVPLLAGLAERENHITPLMENKRNAHDLLAGAPYIISGGIPLSTGF